MKVVGGLQCDLGTEGRAGVGGDMIDVSRMGEL